jgi:hypothetical protein
MSLTWERIDGLPNPYAKTVWEKEQQAPRWFREAGNVWTRTFVQFLNLMWLDHEVYGLFEGEKLVACVYVKHLAPHMINVHVSVIDRVRSDALVRFFRSIRNYKAEQGVTVMIGWLLNRNRGLIRLAREAGFEETGAVMMYGKDTRTGGLLRWMQMRAV